MKRIVHHLVNLATVPILFFATTSVPVEVIGWTVFLLPNSPDLSESD